MQLSADFFAKTSKILSVSELTRSIRGTLSPCHSERSREISRTRTTLQEREICPTQRQLLISFRKPRRCSLSLSSREASAARSPLVIPSEVEEFHEQEQPCRSEKFALHNDNC